MISAIQFTGRPIQVEDRIYTSSVYDLVDQLFSLPFMEGIKVVEQDRTYKKSGSFHSSWPLIATAARIVVITSLVLLGGKKVITILGMSLLVKVLVRLQIYTSLVEEEHDVQAAPQEMTRTETLLHWLDKCSWETKYYLSATGFGIETQHPLGEERMITINIHEDSIQLPYSFLTSLEYFDSLMRFDDIDDTIHLDSQTPGDRPLLDFLYRLFNLDSTITADQIPGSYTIPDAHFLLIPPQIINMIHRIIEDNVTRISRQQLEGGHVPFSINGADVASFPDDLPIAPVPSCSLDTSVDVGCMKAVENFNIDLNENRDKAYAGINRFLKVTTESELPKPMKHLRINRIFDAMVQDILHNQALSPENRHSFLLKQVTSNSAIWKEYLTVITMSSSFDYTKFGELTEHFSQLLYLSYNITPHDEFIHNTWQEWLGQWGPHVRQLKFLHIDGLSDEIITQKLSVLDHIPSIAPNNLVLDL